MIARFISSICIAIVSVTCALPAAEFAYTGVNLAGAEFGEIPGTFNIHYTYPSQTEVDYFKSKGMNVIRLPFRWERLQRSLHGDLDAEELGRLNAFVSATTGKGMSVILDPHNYARYNNQVIGSAAVPFSAFSDFWSRIAAIYRTNNLVIFGLMNEPHDMTTETWRDAANAAIASIRDIGATNLILVPGNGWTGAHSWSQNWYGSPNAVVMLTINDPATNYAFEVHQYLDLDSSGTSPAIVSPTIGMERLTNFTAWLEANNLRGFLGEFAVANSTIGNGQTGSAALTNMLNYMRAHSDVWLGWTWWAAGPWWGEYLFTLEPQNLGQPDQSDRPTMTVLEHIIRIPAPTLSVEDGNLILLNTAPGFLYQPQFTTNLWDSNWTNEGTGTIGTGQAESFAMTISPMHSRFYRVQVTRLP